MATGKAAPSGLEWRVTVPEGSSVTLEPESGLLRRAWLGLLGLLTAIKSKVFGFAKMVWRLGADDPRKVIHGFKVGIALALVSLFYYTRPLYDGVGGAAMWAVMTVVVVFEFTVGKHKCTSNLNRHETGLLDFVLIYLRVCHCPNIYKYMQGAACTKESIDA